MFCCVTIIIDERQAVQRKCANPNCTKILDTRNRCSPCQRYFAKHNEERPKSWCVRKTYRHAKVKILVCKVCGSPKVRSNGRCVACESYYIRHNGEQRPRWFWDKTFGCLTCGIPLASLKPNERSAGRCKPCHQYLWKMGKERPHHLWGIGEFGWCRCGRPATVQRSDAGYCRLCVAGIQ